MAEISPDIVEVQLTADTKGPSQKGFGVPNVITGEDSPAWLTGERSRSYTSAAAASIDWPTTTAAYKMVNRLFSGQLKPPKARVSRLKGTGRPLERVLIGLSVPASPPASTKHAFRFGTGGMTANAASAAQEIDATSDATPNNDEIITALKADLDAKSISGITTSIVGGAGVTKLQVDGVAGLHLFAELRDADGIITGPGPAGLNLLTLDYQTPDPAATIAAELNAIKSDAAGDFYTVLNPYQGQDLGLAIADWVESNELLYIQAAADTDIITTVPAGATDFAAAAKTASYGRTAIMYHHRPDQFADAGWAGLMLPVSPGRDQWFGVELTGVDTTELTDSHVNNAVSAKNNVGKNANVYHRRANLGETFNGRTASGGWIDLIRQGDLIKARLAERVYVRLRGPIKNVPQSNAGIGVIENELRGMFRDAVKMGILSPDRAMEFNIPKITDVPTADLVERRLPDMDGSAYFAPPFNHVIFRLNIRV